MTTRCLLSSSKWKSECCGEWGGGVWKVANECHLSSTFSLNSLLSVCHMGWIYPLVRRFGQMLRMRACTRPRRHRGGPRAHVYTHTHTQPVALYESKPPLGWTGIISRRWFMMEMGNVFSRTTWVTSFSKPENKYRPPHCTLALACVVVASQHRVSHTSPTLLLGAPRGAILPLYLECPCEICAPRCIFKSARSHMHVNVLCFRCAVVVCVAYWNRSFSSRPAISPVRLPLGWYICTVDISQHQHLAPGSSYDFSSCRSFVLPLVTLWPMIHTHKEGPKSYKNPPLELSALLKKATFLHAMTSSFSILDHERWTRLFH